MTSVNSRHLCRPCTAGSGRRLVGLMETAQEWLAENRKPLSFVMLAIWLVNFGLWNLFDVTYPGRFAVQMFALVSWVVLRITGSMDSD